VVPSSSADIEKRIKAFNTIEDIVGAMRAYAGVTIRKTEDIVPNIREYEQNMLSAMADVMTHNPDIPSMGRNEKKRILVAFGSSQGLCGPYNEKVADAVSQVKTGKDVLFVIGKRLKSSIELRDISFEVYNDAVLSVNGIQAALKETVSRIMEIYKMEEYYNLTFIFTCVSEKKPEISVEQVLPPDISGIGAIKPLKIPPVTYLEPKILFDKILEEFLYISLYRGYLESLRSENWYRMRSMEGALETLKKRLSELKSLQNYTRQEEITEEMLEILGSGMFYK
jgi:F-type H+-transporting ATPase subunit gamma